jgi:hypothetical protein
MWSKCFWDGYDHVDIEDGVSGEQMVKEESRIDDHCIWFTLVAAIAKTEGFANPSYDLKRRIKGDGLALQPYTKFEISYVWSEGLACIRSLSMRCDHCAETKLPHERGHSLLIEVYANQSDVSFLALRAVVRHKDVRLCGEYVGCQQGRLAVRVTNLPEKKEEKRDMPAMPCFTQPSSLRSASTNHDEGISKRPHKSRFEQRQLRLQRRRLA